MGRRGNPCFHSFLKPKPRAQVAWGRPTAQCPERKLSSRPECLAPAGPAEGAVPSEVPEGNVFTALGYPSRQK